EPRLSAPVPDRWRRGIRRPAARRSRQRDGAAAGPVRPRGPQHRARAAVGLQARHEHSRPQPGVPVPNEQAHPVVYGCELGALRRQWSRPAGQYSRDWIWRRHRHYHAAGPDPHRPGVARARWEPADVAVSWGTLLTGNDVGTLERWKGEELRPASPERTLQLSNFPTLQLRGAEVSRDADDSHERRPAYRLADARRRRRACLGPDDGPAGGGRTHL